MVDFLSKPGGILQRPWPEELQQLPPDLLKLHQAGVVQVGVAQTQ